MSELEERRCNLRSENTQMKPVFLVMVALAGLLMAGCGAGGGSSYVDDEAAKLAANKQNGPTEKCAVCGRDFPEGSLKDHNGKRMCGTCIDSEQS